MKFYRVKIDRDTEYFFKASSYLIDDDKLLVFFDQNDEEIKIFRDWLHIWIYSEEEAKNNHKLRMMFPCE